MFSSTRAFPKYLAIVRNYSSASINDVVVLSAVRTPIGSFRGSLSLLTAPQLGAFAIRNAIEKAGVPADRIDEVCYFLPDSLDNKL